MTYPTLVVFDIDGTLFQTELVTVPAVQRTFAAHGLPVPDAEKICSFFGRPNEEYLDWLASMCSPERAREIVDDTNRLELELVTQEGRLYDGARGVLETLKAEGYGLGVCSNGPEDYVDAFLDGHQVRSFFDIVRTRGLRYDGKTEMLRDIIAVVRAQEVIMIGDRHDDVLAAHASGALALATCYGFGARHELHDADARVNSIAEIPEAVRGLLAKARRPL